MKKKGWILLLVLVCVAFLVSCGKKASGDDRQGELVRTQAEDRFPSACFAPGKAWLNPGKNKKEPDWQFHRFHGFLT